MKYQNCNYFTDVLKYSHGPVVNFWTETKPGFFVIQFQINFCSENIAKKVNASFLLEDFYFLATKHINVCS